MALGGATGGTGGKDERCAYALGGLRERAKHRRAKRHSQTSIYALRKLPCRLCFLVPARYQPPGQNFG